MKCSIGLHSVSRWALWLLPLWLPLLCSCTIGSEFSAVEASPAPVLGFAAEAGPGDASTAETSFSETPAVDPPPREDAGVSLEGASDDPCIGPKCKPVPCGGDAGYRVCDFVSEKGYGAAACCDVHHVCVVAFTGCGGSI